MPVAEGVDEGGDSNAAAGEEDRGGDGAEYRGVEQLERYSSGCGAGGEALCAPAGGGQKRLRAGVRKQIHSGDYLLAEVVVGVGKAEGYGSEDEKVEGGGGVRLQRGEGGARVTRGRTRGSVLEELQCSSCSQEASVCV